MPALTCVIAPEVLAIIAVTDLVRAREAKHHMGQILKGKTSLAQGFFLEMGGICLETPSGKYHQVGKRDLEKVATIVEPILNGPGLSGDSINDLGKSDALTKTFACVQTLWFVTQVIARLGEHKAITLLEVSTSAYVLCAVFAYAAWWKKPQDCSMPVMIACSDDIVEGLQPTEYPEKVGTISGFLWGGRRVPEAESSESEKHHLLAGFLVLCPIFFGAVHMASWNFTLPSLYELWIWRASSVYCIAFGPLCFILNGLRFLTVLDLWLARQFDKSLISVYILYILVRLCMIVEVFISLRALPHSAYDSVQWSTYVPHI